MKNVHVLILLSVGLAAFAQIVLKAGMMAGGVQSSLRAGAGLAAAAAILSNPLVLFGLFLYFLGAAVWLLVLARAEVSSVYPFVALGFVLTAVLGRLIFHDSFSAAKIAGTLLIVAGTIVLARG